ncbi:DUF6942 family protein [Motilimonas eburnea]|uniref:DUF6942 family protein n=1 Tax=Motilimonas eburnea TaxID=1737488 RepID=UPI001E40E925|nr:hypothetical protein [Motilimonas eburnea]MCE2570307.1 hypothetical protein [Motilimonas eburnea]
MQQHIGLGCTHMKLAVYIANRPDTADYQQMTEFRALQKGDIAAINLACGNGWRKVFNVYAKLVAALGEPYQSAHPKPATWQDYRDSHLLQRHSKTALLFSAPSFPLAPNVTHLIMGKTYANQLLRQANLFDQLVWVEPYLALLPKQRLIVCPYFDYRQLSNAKLARLVEIIHAMDKRLPA